MTLPESTPQSPPPLALGMAISSAVMGILSFVFFPICGMAALILGIEELLVISFVLFPICGMAALILGVVAKKRISKSNGRLLGKGEAKTGIALGALALICFPLIVALLIPPYIAARHKAQEIYCSERLKKIAIVFNMYADEHDGYLPTLDSEDFKALLSKVFVKPELEFECPRGRKKYRVFVNGQELSKINDPANTVFAFCDHAHRYDQIIVVFADEHCEKPCSKSYGGNGRAEAVRKAIQECPEGKLPVLDIDVKREH